MYHAVLLACFVSAVNFSLGFLAGKDSVKQPAPVEAVTNYVAAIVTNATPGFVKLEPITNATPIVTHTNSVESVNAIVINNMFETFSAGIKLGAAAAWHGASKPDIEAIQSFVMSNRLDLVTEWFEAHPAK